MPPRDTATNRYATIYDTADIYQTAASPERMWSTVDARITAELSAEMKDMIQKIVDKRVEELLTSKDFILGKLPDKAEEIPFDSI